MDSTHKKAFTMIELVFVIVVIGILSAVAIPRFAATRDDAVISKAKATVASVRNAVATERQKRILRGDFDAIFGLSSTSAGGTGVSIFNAFDNNQTNSVLEYAKTSCATASTTGCWIMTTKGTSSVPAVYTFNMPISGTAVFELNASRFDCQDLTSATCKLLTQ